MSYETKMSADEVLADLQHVHDIYGIDLSRTIRGVAALIADAARYRYIRDAASRDHQHHTRRAFTAGIVDWSRNLSLNDAEPDFGFWASRALIGEDLDAEIDAAIDAARINEST